MDDHLNRTVNAIMWEQETLEIRAMLLASGLSEYQAWLTYKGAQIIVQARREMSEKDGAGLLYSARGKATVPGFKAVRQ